LFFFVTSLTELQLAQKTCHGKSRCNDRIVNTTTSTHSIGPNKIRAKSMADWFHAQCKDECCFDENDDDEYSVDENEDDDYSDEEEDNDDDLN
jgi:hypothetical protein